jgi:hypothetical protein
MWQFISTFQLSMSKETFWKSISKIWQTQQLPKFAAYPSKKQHGTQDNKSSNKPEPNSTS